MLLVGEDASPIIESNIFEGNCGWPQQYFPNWPFIYRNGSAIKIGISNKASVLKNQIRLNDIGIEINSGDPLIFHNTIEINNKHGQIIFQN